MNAARKMLTPFVLVGTSMLLAACATQGDDPRLAQQTERVTVAAAASCPEGQVLTLQPGSAYQTECRADSGPLVRNRPPERLRQPLDKDVRDPKPIDTGATRKY